MTFGWVPLAYSGPRNSWPPVARIVAPCVTATRSPLSWRIVVVKFPMKPEVATTLLFKCKDIAGWERTSPSRRCKVACGSCGSSTAKAGREEYICGTLHWDGLGRLRRKQGRPCYRHTHQFFCLVCGYFPIIGVHPRALVADIGHFHQVGVQTSCPDAILKQGLVGER